MKKGKQERSKARLFFMRGIASLLPTILTILILVLCYRFVHENIATPINHTIHKVLVQTGWGRDILEAAGLELDLEDYRYRVGANTEWRSFRKADSDQPDREKLREVLNDTIHPILGFLIGLLIIFFIGVFLASFLGRRLFARFERALSKFPVVKVIYPYAKQLVDFFFKEKRRMDLSSVVAFEYPRKGIWAIGFMTGEGMRSIHDMAGRPIRSVFIPSSPAPMTGYTVFIPRDDLVPLDIDVEEAFRLIITAGVVVPESQQVTIDLKHATPIESDTADEAETAPEAKKQPGNKKNPPQGDSA